MRRRRNGIECAPQARKFLKFDVRDGAAASRWTMTSERCVRMTAAVSGRRRQRKISNLDERDAAAAPPGTVATESRPRRPLAMITTLRGRAAGEEKSKRGLIRCMIPRRPGHQEPARAARIEEPRVGGADECFETSRGAAPDIVAREEHAGIARARVVDVVCDAQRRPRGGDDRRDASP